jgi:hypothetical protein
LDLVIGNIIFQLILPRAGVGGNVLTVLTLSGKHVLDLLHQSHEIGNLRYLKFQFFTEVKIHILLL